MTDINVEQPISLDRHRILARVDYVGDSQRVGGRVSVSRPSRPDFVWTPYEDFRSTLKQPAFSLALNTVQQFGPDKINELRFGWGRDDLSWDRPHPEIPTLVAGAIVERDGEQVARPVWLPGSPASYEFRNLGQSWELNDNFMITKGPHSLKFGGGFLARRLEGRLTFARDGLYDFRSMVRFLDDRPRSLWVALDRESLEGSEPKYQRPDYDRRYSYSQAYAFIQDTIRLAPGFNLNIGARYENFGSPTTTSATKDATVELGEGVSFSERLQNARFGFPGPGDQRVYASDNNDFAVRLGFSYAPGRNGSTVLRGAYGIFYDRPFDNLWLNHRNNSMALEIFDVGGSKYLPVEEQLRLLPPPDPENPVSRPDPTPLLFDSALRTGYAHSYFFSAERRLSDDFSLTLNAYGSAGRGLITTDVVNRVPSPNQPMHDIYYRAGQGRSSYAAFSALARRRWRRGILQAAYTWGHSIDNQSDPIDGDFFDLAFTSFVQEGQDSRRAVFAKEFRSDLDRGNSDFDQRHNLVFLTHWEVPEFFSGRRAGLFLRDWTVGAIGAFRTGFPYTVRAASKGQIRNQRADIVNPALTRVATEAVPGGRRLLNGVLGEGFAEPNREELGNSGRNAFLGPGRYNLDLSMGRRFRPNWLGEAGALTFRADVFNVLNHANLGQPDSFLSSENEQFGQALFGSSPTQSGFPALTPLGETPRQFQLILRIQF